VTDPPFHVVLLNPEIPNNTGNIGRTCAATGCRLHIIHPIGFDMDEKALRRAGLDYWHMVDCVEHESWASFVATETPKRLWLFTTRSGRVHWDTRFARGDYMLFGKETTGAPTEIHDWVTKTYGDTHRIHLPMDPGARSLNLATVVCAAVYEGLRQVSGRT
jgi:tRNA (cytidine/uridine-2'-O-)-methyltransferase